MYRSFSPTATAWAEFRAWFKELPADFRPHVDRLVPNEWFKSFEAQGTQNDMWEMWYVHQSIHRCLMFNPYLITHAATNAGL